MLYMEGITSSVL